jgi:hypothetical protein
VLRNDAVIAQNERADPRSADENRVERHEGKIVA